MKVITDEKRIARNAKIGTWASLGGMAVLGIGLYLSLAQPQYLAVSMICLLAGMVLSNVGLYNANRWVKSPRPDEVLTKVLKGFDRRYTLYNYELPVDHVLVGPSGLVVIETRNHEGVIRYTNGRWRQKINLLRVFGFLGEGVGNPVRDAERAASKLRRFLAEKVPDLAETPVEPVIVFTNEKASLDVQNPPLPVFDPKGLQDFVRKAPKDALSGGEIRQLAEAFER